MTDSTTGRRDALKHLAGGAIALASLGAAACASPAQAISTGPTPSNRPLPGPGNWDMSWMQRVNKKRRMVFDTSAVDGGMGLSFAAAYLDGAVDAYGDPDASTVVVHRHASVPVVLNDDMWKRLGLGESTKMKDSKGEFYVKNPFLSHNQTGNRDGYDAIDKMMEKGTIIVACNRALSGRAFSLAQKEKISNEEAKKQLFAAIIPGVYVVPNGIFGVCAAQEDGCGYIRVQN